MFAFMAKLPGLGVCERACTLPLPSTAQHSKWGIKRCPSAHLEQMGVTALLSEQRKRCFGISAGAGNRIHGSHARVLSRGHHCHLSQRLEEMPAPSHPTPRCEASTHVSSGILVWGRVEGRRQKRQSSSVGTAPRPILHAPTISEGTSQRDVGGPCSSCHPRGVPVRPPPCCRPGAPRNGRTGRQLRARSRSGSVIPRQPLNPLAEQQQPQI